VTQTVELIAQTTQDNARNIAQLTGEISEHARQISEHSRLIGVLSDASSALLEIAKIHENRVSRLEDRPY
jgi:hypothetical protein